LEPQHIDVVCGGTGRADMEITSKNTNPCDQSLGEFYFDRDLFFYQSFLETQTDGLWRSVSEETCEKGRRKRIAVKEHPDYGRTYWKCDHEYYECLQEKICADLGQILQLKTPPAILTLWNEEVALVSKVPSLLFQPMHQIRGDKLLPSKDPMRLRDYEKYYPLEMIAFDLWVDNWDKKPANLIFVSEENTIYSVDYGWSLGFGERRESNLWDDGMHLKVRKHDCGSVPVPVFVTKFRDELSQILKIADNIKLIPDDQIKCICTRAAMAYRHKDVETVAGTIANRLIERKHEMTSWLKQLL
jgi:hypothetical protein